MPVSIVLSNDKIKIVSARRSVPEKWKTLAIPAGMVRDGQILDPGALAEIIDGLFSSMDLPRNEVVVSIAGISFTYRFLALPGVKSGQQGEAIERATRRELKVPLDELYIDWQIFSDSGNEIRVFVLGIPRLLIDALVKTMSLAKVNLVQFDINPLALARAVKQDDALIVDFEPDRFDIAIISGGLPVTLHTAAPKSRGASLDDNILRLKDELNRTIEFFNLTNKSSPISPDTAVILTGSQADDEATAALILEKLGRPGRKISFQGKLPGNYPLNLYAGNLGLILKNVNRGKPAKNDTNGYIDVNVDLLQGRKRAAARPLSFQKIIPYAVIILAVIILIAVLQIRNTAVAEAGKLQAEYDRVSRSLRLSRLSLDEAVSIESEISRLKAETLELQKEYELISGSGELSQFFMIVYSSLPAGAYYSRFSSTPDGLDLEGRAASRSDVIEYANTLAETGIFSEIRIALIDEEREDNESGQAGQCTFRIIIER
ncbi:MAG: PilN domain-containing protein [Dehalococcoidales bacterium]|nr:PilN domain-containing protein [Dehalococcoidales bacterium]